MCDLKQYLFIQNDYRPTLIIWDLIRRFQLPTNNLGVHFRVANANFVILLTDRQKIAQKLLKNSQYERKFAEILPKPVLTLHWTTLSEPQHVGPVQWSPVTTLILRGVLRRVLEGVLQGLLERPKSSFGHSFPRPGQRLEMGSAEKSTPWTDAGVDQKLQKDSGAIGAYESFRAHLRGQT